MKTSNKHKATITLGVVSAGFLLSYPFSDFFAGALISSACAAAMIGGVADWFAVSALFRRPLGIPFRTAIIPRNREKIFNALARTVEQELLTGENVRKTLRRYDLTGLITHYLADHDGAAHLRQAFATIISSIVIHLNADKIGRIVELVVKRNIEKASLSGILAEALEWLAARGYTVKIAEFAAEQLSILAKHEKVHQLLVELLTEARLTYERGMVKRRIFNLLLNISPEEVASIIQRLFVIMLKGIKAEEHPVHDKIWSWLTRLIVELRTNPELQDKVEAWKLSQLQGLHMRQTVAGAIEAFRQDAGGTEEKAAAWVAVLIRQFEYWLAEVAADPEKRQAFDESAKQTVAGWIEQHHEEVGVTVRDSLNQLNDKLLVAFIEEKVGNDLQMIRINGSLVGGLAGAIIFLILSGFR